MFTEGLNRLLCSPHLDSAILEPRQMTEVIHSTHVEHQGNKVAKVLVLMLSHVAHQRSGNVPLVIAPVEASEEFRAIDSGNYEASKVRLVPIDLGEGFSKRCNCGRCYTLLLQVAPPRLGQKQSLCGGAGTTWHILGGCKMEIEMMNSPSSPRRTESKSRRQLGFGWKPAPKWNSVGLSTRIDSGPIYGISGNC